MAKKNRIRGSKKGRQSGHNKLTGKYTRQRIRTQANKKRKLQKHIKQHPNDLTARNAIGQ